MSEVLALTQDLIARRSVTPEDAGCQELIAARLARAGFNIEHLPFGDVDNLWATHGQGGPVLVFLGHTDVVPSGPVEAWQSDPFVPTIRDGHLYGRGAADMKGSVAAFVIALEEYARLHPNHAGTVAVLLTSDEEGDAIDGVRRVMDEFRARGQRIEPAKMKSWAQQLGGWDKLVNKASTTWRNLPEMRKTPGSDPEWTLLIKEHPALVKRPVVLMPDGSVTIGFSDNGFKQLFGVKPK
jgi:arsenate reductase-like glutaredoxin family protein